MTDKKITTTETIDTYGGTWYPEIPPGEPTGEPWHPMQDIEEDPVEAAIEDEEV